MSKLKKGLVEEGASPVLATLAELKPEDETGTEEVRKGIGYFTEHAARIVAIDCHLCKPPVHKISRRKILLHRRLFAPKTS